MAQHIDTVIFDKTGTITQWQAARGGGASALAGSSEREVLRLAAAVERYSEHPLGKAIVEARRRAQGIALETVTAFSALPASGVRALVGGRDVTWGSRE